MDFSLFSLPIATQAVYSVLVMIPVGALVIMLLRNFVGVKTFGTFMPVLVALAFRETRLLWGLVLFAIIVSLGLLIRFYLEKLRLLLVPRLTCVLTVVVILMAGISVLSQKLDIQPGLSIALFPMVIISMTIERMSIVWEERGASEAIQEGVGSLLVAAVAYVVMDIAWLEHLVFVFPELLLLVIALTLLVGSLHWLPFAGVAPFQGAGAVGERDVKPTGVGDWGLESGTDSVWLRLAPGRSRRAAADAIAQPPASSRRIGPDVRRHAIWPTKACLD